MNKKLLPVIVIAILIIGGGGILAFSKMKKQPEPPVVAEKAKKRARAQENQIAVSDRPYITISPKPSGRNVVIQINDLKKPATKVEYELEYQAGTLLQGAFGSLDLASTPASADVLLGSCSAGGACTYHEDVKGGTLLLDFQGEENYVLKQDWKYVINSKRESAHSSRDAKFQIEGTPLSKQSYLIIYNSPGYPTGLTGAPVSDTYSLQTAAPLTGKANLTMRATEEGNLVIMGYNGQTWQEFAGQVEGKSITAEVELLPVYVVVKK